MKSKKIEYWHSFLNLDGVHPWRYERIKLSPKEEKEKWLLLKWIRFYEEHCLVYDS